MAARRLMREAQELSSTSPSASPDFTAQPVSDSNLYEWHFTIAGPPSTPYASGTYHGRITLPAQYPLRPPSFRFLTPSGRFEVNREICLSISGHHEETWQPAWGIRTALLAIGVFMESESAGQLGGIDASDEVRRDWASKSRTWKCDVCGKTNQQIMDDWRQELHDNGIGVEKPEDDDSKTAGDVDRTTPQTEKEKGEGEETKSVREDATGSSEDLSRHSDVLSASSSNPPATAALNTVIATQSQPQPQLQQEPPRQSVQVEPLTEDKLLDLAITGVFISLLLMILKKAFF
ncbi:Ubiquitin-conjugating enzyme/RWD-like protein [Ascosphaera apis ARSEF 7405]|uniref:Ubiquitin-conjugating enzyme/RWD-like protein n=1 Tax=Ascosphaera apis ARSEF 7405 TaxID=392613 RepID=A0A168BRD1_9EURO|nr:Ubiquitin-conjugating enzyme/RWD-like protein [Ascosphaera apis ARSEF 7405]